MQLATERRHYPCKEALAARWALLVILPKKRQNVALLALVDFCTDMGGTTS